jgi:hypothetical protein
LAALCRAAATVINCLCGKDLRNTRRGAEDAEKETHFSFLRHFSAHSATLREIFSVLFVFPRRADVNLALGGKSS